MFCVECGKEGPIFRDGVCKDCYFKTHTFTKGPSEIDMPVCSHCNSFKYKSNWTNDLFGDAIRRVIKNKFEISKELKKVDVNTECQETSDGMQCKVYISAYLDNVEITEEHDLIVHLKKTVCDVCSKKFGGYHEATIQIRTDERKLSKKELEEIVIDVENLVEQLRSKGNRGLFITDIAKEHGGLDFYISDKQTSLIIVKKLQEKYGGSVKQSSKNIGMKDSRQIYRMTYLLRLSPYKKNDFIKLKNKYYQILWVRGRKIKIKNLSNWEEITFDENTIEKVKILGGKELIKEMIIVSQKENEIQLMDPKTYEIKIIRKPKPVDFKSEKVQIVQFENKLFLPSFSELNR